MSVIFLTLGNSVRSDVETEMFQASVEHEDT
jgi:hypothetical protein